MNWILIAFLVLAILFLSACIALAHFVVYGTRQQMDASWQWQMEHIPACRRFRREDFEDYTVTGEDGYVYHVSYLPAKVEGSDRVVILAHGYTDTRFGMMKYIQFYYDLGFHCITFDERGHGENRPVPCSYGIRESRGLMSVYGSVRERFGPDARIGLHGESLGGATVLRALEYRPDISFVVDDCGFSEILPVLKVGLRAMKLPQWLLGPVTLAAKVFYGVPLKDARPIDFVKGNPVPLLIMHGARDDFILPEHSEKIRRATAGYCEMHLFEEAGHAESALRQPEKYGKVLREFLEQIGYLPKEAVKEKE